VGGGGRVFGAHMCDAGPTAFGDVRHTRVERLPVPGPTRFMMPRLGPAEAHGPMLRLRHAWRRARWWVVASAALTAGVLGWIGYNHYAHRLHLPWPTHLLYTLQLFRLSVPTAPKNAPLEAGFWLAAATTGYVAFRAVSNLFSEQVRAYRAQHFTRDHTIICGLGEIGIRVATGIAKQGHTVVAIEASPSVTITEDCRERGIVLVAGDASDQLTLTRAGLPRAQRLIVTCGADGTNAAVALAAQQLPSQRKEPLQYIVQIDDDRLSALLEQVSLTGSTAHQLTTDFFNVVRAGSRALLDSHLPPAGSRIPEVVVVGSGPIATQVVTEVARRCVLDDVTTGRRILGLWGPVASERVAMLRDQHPELDKTTDLVPRDVDASDDRTDVVGRQELVTGPDALVLVCEEDDNTGLRAALRLHRILPRTVKIVLTVTGRLGTEGLLRLTRAESLPNLEAFPVLDQVCLPEVFLKGRLELLAQAVHANYVADERARGQRPPTDRALVPWEELPETLRAANRAQVDDIGEKLKTIQCRMEPTATWVVPTAAFTETEVHDLSVAEHERWKKERLDAGWRWGPTRDAEARTHPSLVDWDDLDPDDQARDRDAVTHIPVLLAQAGYAVVHDDPAVTPEEA
jgi:hypothetical protein